MTGMALSIRDSVVPYELASRPKHKVRAVNRAGESGDSVV